MQNREGGKEIFLRLSANLFSQLCVAVLQLIVHCGYIKMIMNKCIINSTPPSVDSLNIATRGNENIIVSSEPPFPVARVVEEMTKSNTAGHHGTFSYGRRFSNKTPLFPCNQTIIFHLNFYFYRLASM